MTRFLFLLATLLAIAHTITDQEVIQLTLNGAFEENLLPDPTTIVPCIDDETARKIVVFTGEILFKATKSSLTDFVQIIYYIKTFGNQIPQPVKNCLGGNKEFEALGLKYGIDGSTDSSALEKKIITYISLHFLEFHRFAIELNSVWVNLEFYNTGFKAATYAHKVLASWKGEKYYQSGSQRASYVKKALGLTLTQLIEPVSMRRSYHL